MTAAQIKQRAEAGQGLVRPGFTATDYFARPARGEVIGRRPCYVATFDLVHTWTQPTVSVYPSPEAAFRRMGLGVENVPEVLR